MAVEAETVQFDYMGDGVSTVFPFPSKFLSSADIIVTVDDEILGAGFVVTGAGNESGGNVTFTGAPVLGAAISLLRDPPISQLTAFEDAAATLGGTLENTVDKLTMIAQAQRRRQDGISELITQVLQLLAAASSVAQLSVLSFGVKADCLINGFGVVTGGTDNLLAFQSAFAYSTASGVPVRMPAGRYYSSNGFGMGHPADTSIKSFRPNITGDGARATHLHFGPGNFNGLSVQGTNVQGPGAEALVVISGLSLHKGDGLGIGLALSKYSHIRVDDVFVEEWLYGLSMSDVQESMFTNLDCSFNVYGGIIAIGAFTKPNGLCFVGCKFAGNHNFGLQVNDPAAFSFIGGSIESNGAYGTDAPTTKGGLRFIFTDPTFPETNFGGSIIGTYFERNGGQGDIYYANSIRRGGLVVEGCTFNRNSNQSLPVTFTVSIASPGVFTTQAYGSPVAHTLTVGDIVYLYTTGTLPTGVTASIAGGAVTRYYVSATPTSTTFQVSATLGGGSIATTGTQTGAHSVVMRHFGASCVRLEGTGYHQYITLNTGFGGLPVGGEDGHLVNANKPYVGVLNPGPYWHIAGAPNFADPVEAPDFGLLGLSYTPEFATTAWAATTDTHGAIGASGNVAGIVESPTATYTVTFRAPLKDALYSITYAAVGGQFRVFSTTAKSAAAFSFTAANLSGTLTASQFDFQVSGKGNL